MENYNEQLATLKTYASFYDAIGDYNSADECTEIMIKISSMQNQNIKTAFLKGLERKFRKTFVDPIKKLGKGIDKFVRKSIPGGWVTVVGLAVAGGALGSGNAQYLKQFFAKGGGLDKLMAGSPMQKALGQTLLTTATKSVAGLAGGAGGASGGGSAQQSGAPINWGMNWQPSTNVPTSSNVAINSPQGLIVNFQINSLSKIKNALNENQAQQIFNKIKSEDVNALKKSLSDMTKNQNPPEFAQIAPALNIIKQQIFTDKRWKLQ